MHALGLIAAAIALLVSACTAPGQAPEAAPTIDPGFVHGTDHGDIDRLAATIVTEAQHYWSQAYPATFSGAWHNLDGGFFSVDSNGTGRPPPCASDVADLQGNAYFCPAVDAIAWDRAALLPVLREHYGDASVAVVLAHEIGHAVQQRAGLDHTGQFQQETTSDCYAGSFLRWVVDGHGELLRVTPQQLDGALRAIIVFRDPVGAAAEHGSAFDRVSAFQNGFRDGPGRCAEPVPAAPVKTVLSDPNASLDRVLRTRAPSQFFGALVTREGKHWTAPTVRESPGCPDEAGAVVLCGPVVVIDRAALAETHAAIGDEAVTTLLASRYALAALHALGQPADGARVSCLTGTFVGSRAGLSPGDLDEAVEVVLTSDAVSRTTDGPSGLSGFDRVESFRHGVLDGTPACG